MRKEIINLSGKSAAPFPSAVKAGDFIFVSGQVGHIDENGNQLTGIEAQTRRCLENVKNVLAKAGSSLNRVVKVTVFLSDVKDYPQMNEVYRTYFPEEPPARSTAIAGPRDAGHADRDRLHRLLIYLNKQKILDEHKVGQGEDKIMDTTSLIIIAIGAVMIAVGAPLFFVGRYLLAPEDRRKQRARSIRILGIVWMAVGVLIYIEVFLRVVFKVI